MFIFGVLSSIFSAYSLLCFVRILLSWFPGAAYSKFGRLLSQLCDPYLNIFRRFSFLRFSAFDFTPAIALCILFAASTLCANLSTGAAFKIGYLLAMLISMVWSIFSSILVFLAVIFIVRLIVYFLKKDSSYYSIWNSVDNAISPVIFRISGMFSRNTPFHKALIISIITTLAFAFIGKILVGFVCMFLTSLPF